MDLFAFKNQQLYCNKELKYFSSAVSSNGIFQRCGKSKEKIKKIKKHLHFEKKDDILMELTKTAENKTENDAWLSLVERYVRDVEVAGSNPVASIPWQGRVEKSGKIFGFFFYSMRELWEYEVRNNSYGFF